MKSNMKLGSLMGILLMTAVGCGGDGGKGGCTTCPPPAPTVSSVVVTPSAISLSVGTACTNKTQQFTRIVNGSEGVAQTGTWTADLGTVDQNGFYTATASGTATVRFTSSVDASKSGAGTATVGNTTCVVNTRDSTSLRLASADSLAGAPVGLTVSTRAYKGNVVVETVVTPVPSFMQVMVISLPLGTDGVEHQISGDTRYEKLGFGRRFTRGEFLNKTISGVLKPNCWLIRVSEEYAGQQSCVSSTQVRTSAGVQDVSAFWSGGALWAQDLLPAKILLVVPSPAPWSPADIQAVQDTLAHANRTLGMQMFQYGGTVADSMPVFGRSGITKVIRWNISGLSNGGGAGDDKEKWWGQIHLSSATISPLPHELMHTLGFGHTCSWLTSMAADIPECSGKGRNFITRDDVGVIQMIFSMRAMEKKLGAQLGFRESTP